MMSIMKLRIFLMTVLFSVQTVAFAQPTVRGYVRDTAGNPVAGVAVSD